MSSTPDAARVFAQHFAAGEEVPSWLCDVEPVTPGGQRPRLYFAAATVVVGTPAAYWLLPAGHVRAPGPPNVIAVDDQHSAPGGVSQMILGERSIFWPIATKTWEDGGGDGGGGSGPDPAPEPWRPTPALRPEPAA
jgi:hypothetical protein